MLSLLTVCGAIISVRVSVACLQVPVNACQLSSKNRCVLCVLHFGLWNMGYGLWVMHYELCIMGLVMHYELCVMGYGLLVMRYLCQGGGRVP